MNRYKPLVLTVLVFMLAALLPAGAEGADRFRTRPSSETSVVVELERGAALEEGPEEALPAPAKRSLRSWSALKSRSNILSLSYPDRESALRALAALQADPAVRAAELNITRELLWEPVGEASYDEQRDWVEQVNLPTAWNITTGSPEIVVAVLDSGVSLTHPDLVDNLILPGYNAVDGSEDASDINGHGTHVAGIIAANGANGAGTAGVAMDVMILPVRVLSDDGVSIPIDAIVDGIYWAVDQGVDVINLSLGDANPSEIERSAIQYAYEQGVVVVGAAGNKVSQISYPASYPEVISVGALDSNGNRAMFSSVVSRVDLAAPGVNIFSPGWSNSSGNLWSDVLNGRPVEGTSFSAPIVSGVVALMESLNPYLDPESIRAILTATATDSGEPGPESGVGAGQLDAEAALRSVAYQSIYDTWYPADYPVEQGDVQRTWLWGTNPPRYFEYEPYVETQHGSRLVYYYDKSRMELTNPLGDRDEPWYVTNGLLVVEMVTGEMQVGDGTFETREPAVVNVAGDFDDEAGPTYATFASVLDAPPLAEGVAVTETLSRDGDVSADPAMADYGVTAGYLEETTGHRVADVFWEYLNSTGLIAAGDELIEGPLFEPWFFGTGYPITEAYWADVHVGGVVQDVLIQCFERRCLTYTPANPEGWQVEMGNIGLHYWVWRYDTAAEPVPEPEPEPVDDEYPADGELLYASTFEDWPDQTFTEGTIFYANGGYHIRVTEPDVFIAQTAAGQEFDDFSVSVEVASVDDTSDAQGCLTFRVATDLSNDYALCVDAEGDVTGLYEGFDEDGETFSDVLFEASASVPAEDLESGVELKAIASGSSLWFLVDGELAGQASHTELTTGTVGVYVLNTGGAQAEYRFTDLQVHALA